MACPLTCLGRIVQCTEIFFISSGVMWQDNSVTGLSEKSVNPAAAERGESLFAGEER